VQRPGRARVTPITDDELVGQTEELLELSMLPQANIFRTLVRAPGLFRKWLPFGGKLLNGKLSARDRELLILRTAWNCRAEYEWAQHVILGKRAGVTDAEIARIASDSTESRDAWDSKEAVLMRAADELHNDSSITDRTWEELARIYDVEQLIELPMLVGHYHLVAMTLNSLGVELDDGLEGFPK
jgi:4-carboxymuconolactone decarboxylase